MKRLIVLLIGAFVLASGTVNATSNEIMIGSLTEHIILPSSSSQKFENKVGDDGRMLLNPMLGVRRTWSLEDGGYTSLAAFGGENSIGEAMVGMFASSGAEFGSHVRFGGVLGGYLQSNEKFRDRGIYPFSMGESQGVGLVPIAGLELSLHAKVSRKTYLTLINILTPALTSTSLGIGFEL